MSAKKDYELRKGSVDSETARNSSILVRFWSERGTTANCVDKFRVYYDREHFRYEVTVTRDDPVSGALGQRYELTVSTPLRRCQN